jgi:rhomboid protease GluP
MAFGFTPKFEQELDLNGLDSKHYLAIALEAVKQLDWKINYKSRSGFIAIIGGGLFNTMEEFRIVIQDTKVFITSKRVTSGMYDFGKNKHHVEDFIEAFTKIQSSLSEEQIEEEIQELSPVFESTEVDQLTLPPPDFKDNVKSFVSFFIPRKDFFITPIIIDLNLLVFISMVISGVSFFEPTAQDLLHWGANLRGITLEGQWWRLVTNVFLHIGIFHILLNMYALLYIGVVLEPYLGKTRFAFAYLFTGILASLSSIYWHPNTVSAGASGAIFGMYGVFLAMLTTNFIDKSVRKPLLLSIGVFVVLNLANGVKDGIDNAAHLGGLISGLVIGYAYYFSLKDAPSLKLKYLTIALLSIAVLATSFTVYHNIPNDYGRYDAYMKDFSINEVTALSVFKMTHNSSNDGVITAFKEKGIDNWNKNLKVIDSIDKLDLPVGFRVRGDKLRRYCRLRIKSYNYIIEDVSTNSRQHRSAIDSCNIQLLAIVDSLKSSN